MTRVQATIIGCGGMARHHMRRILQQQDTTHIPIVCEPAPEAYQATCEVFEEAGVEPPPNEPDLDRLLAGHAGAQGRAPLLDAAFIVTPHAYHHDHAKACLEAGLDVLLEKPMVMNANEARSLIETRDRTGRLLVVAFNGSLSPQIRTAVRMLRSGELGELLSISATVWQGWGPGTAGRWRQQPEISGGGFMFDTGAHMLNTVADLAGEDFAQVAAWLDTRGRPVDTLGMVMGRLKSGAWVTLHGCGETIRTCTSGVWVFCTEAILYTDVWGRWLRVQRQGSDEFEEVPVPASLGVWEQFLAVREGRIANPSPPEVGLRMARLWDAIRASAGQGGAPVEC
jgi:predicted dehydrogenase